VQTPPGPLSFGLTPAGAATFWVAGRSDAVKGQKEDKTEKGDEKTQWFRKDALGFALGLFSILLGIYFFELYVNEAVGKRGAEIPLFAGSVLTIGGLINNMYITIYWLRCWLRKRTGRHVETRD
jgi:hypothetical protein